MNSVKDQSAVLLAVDPHEVWSAKYLLKETGLTTDDLSFPLLMDPTLTTSAEYGVVTQMRIHTEWSNRPATFVIDREGIIQYMKKGNSFADRPTADQIIKEIADLAK